MMESVKLIIERLKTHPEDFFGGFDERGLGHSRPKFYRMVERLDDLLTDKHDGQVHRMWYLTDAERIALLDAYKEARRARFEAQTFHTLLTKQEEVPVSTVTQRYHPHTGKPLMQGANVIAPQSVFKEEGESIDAFPMWQGAVPKGEGEPV